MDPDILEPEKLLSQARSEHIDRFGVGAIIHRGSEVLLLRRRKDDFLPGILDLPGGEVEPDENFHEALLREVKEETGLHVERVRDYVGSFDYKSQDGETTRVFNYAVDVAGPFEVKLSEHNEYIWVTKNNSSRLLLTDPLSKILDAYWSR